MAEHKRTVSTLVLLLLFFSAPTNATRPPATLRIPVVHRDAVFPPPPGASRGSLLSRRAAADAARYAALKASLGLRSSSAHDDRLHSPVMSGLPFDSGEYFASVGVGTPSTSALLVIDTGSDLIWLQCKPCRRCHRQMSSLYDPKGSSTYRQIPCSSPRCFPRHGCDTSTGACGYAMVYGDGSGSRGNLATDRLVFSNDTSVDSVVIGCGHDNAELFDSSAGVLGVGRGAGSLATQVAPTYGRYFAYCLGDRTSVARSSASYLAFGRTPEPPSTAFTPLLSNPRRPNLYYVNMAGFSVGGERVAGGFCSSSLWLDPATGRGGVVVDSGTSISRLPRDVYAALRDAFDARAAAAGMRRLARGISVFDACYELRGASVPAVVLHFAGGADLALPPGNYFIPEQGGKYHCLALEATDDGLSVLGNVLQQGFRVVFDVEKERVGFAPNGC
ncbi:aspartyl protease family protein 2-like [Triticum urartu]|uniref:aspartyl protease family protein 2-like n=1 Tax=Triticum urartu TaxID=4572 RepID=UPI0020448EE7|nr:aspartyl protease family protein 2-like [Triticum urartu]